MKRVLLGALALLAALVLGTIGAGRLGLLRGTAPTDLGVHDGRLKAPSATPNSVSSQATLWPGHRADAEIAPLPLVGAGGAGGAATLARLQALLRDWPGARIVSAREDYLYVQFTTPLLQFTDDAEFWFDASAGVVQVRSASRLGDGDMGVNRKRIETLRERLRAPG